MRIGKERKVALVMHVPFSKVENGKARHPEMVLVPGYLGEVYMPTWI